MTRSARRCISTFMTIIPGKGRASTISFEPVGHVPAKGGFVQGVASADPSIRTRTRTRTQRSGTRFGLARRGHHEVHREHEGRLGEDGARGFLAKTQRR
jgi:hypothetical protein